MLDNYKSPYPTELDNTLAHLIKEVSFLHERLLELKYSENSSEKEEGLLDIIYEHQTSINVLLSKIKDCQKNG